MIVEANQLSNERCGISSKQNGHFLDQVSEVLIIFITMLELNRKSWMLIAQLAGYSPKQ